MAQTLAGLNDVMKRVYTQDRLEKQFYDETPFLSRLQKTKRYTVGEEARVPLHVSRNGGYTPLPDGGGTLNAAGAQGVAKATFNYTNHNIQIALQGSALDGASENAHSVVNSLKLEVDGAVADLRRHAQRQSFMNGDALIAQCESSDTNNVDINTATGIHAIDRGWLHIGLPIDVGTTSVEDDIVNGSLITAVDDTNYGLTVAAGNITTEDGNDYVSVKNARDGTTSYESNGMQNLVSTSTFGNLSPTVEPTWKSTVNATSQALTISLLLQGDQKIHQKTGKKANFILTGLKQERKFYETLQQQVRYQSDSGLNAGNSDLTKWKNMDIFCDPDCQDTDLYMGQIDHVFIVAIDKPYWQNKHTGGNVLDWIQDTDSYGAKLTYRWNLAANRRDCFYRFSALT